MEKRYLSLAEAAAHPESPWKCAHAVRGAYYRAISRKDTKGRVVDTGDPDLASAFVQLASGGPILVDMNRLQEVIDARRGV